LPQHGMITLERTAPRSYVERWRQQAPAAFDA
jgi:hypothetical protein